MDVMKLLVHRLDRSYLQRMVVRITELRRVFLPLCVGKSTFDAFNKIQAILDIAKQALGNDSEAKFPSFCGDGETCKPRAGWVGAINPVVNTPTPDTGRQQMTLTKLLKADIEMIEKLHAKRKMISKMFVKLEIMIKDQEFAELQGVKYQSGNLKTACAEYLQKLNQKQKKYKELLKGEIATRVCIEQKLQLDDLQLSKQHVTLLSSMTGLLLALVQRLSDKGRNGFKSGLGDDSDASGQGGSKVAPCYPFVSTAFPRCKDYDIFLVTMFRKDRDLPLAVSKQRDLYMTVIKAFTGHGPYELTLKVGQKVKQKMGMNSDGMAYGWTRSHRYGRKHYGCYPADCLTLQEETNGDGLQN